MSVLDNLSKVFENLSYSRLQSFCHTSNFLAKNQFGFRKHPNSELAALSILDKILPVLEDEKYTMCVFLDYSAYFDNLSRSILYGKLERYGIHGVSLDFTKAYYENRSHYVCYDAFNSSIRSKELGVIQGSKTGPLFFDIYSCDFARLCSNDGSC